MDKKSLIGLGLIALIMGVWLYLSGPSEAQIKQAKKQRDSMDLVERKAFEKQRQEQANKAISNASLNPLPMESDSVKNNREREQYRDFLPARHGLDTHCVLENQQLKVIISTKGGIIQQVYLSSYHRPGSKQPLPLFIADSSQMNLQWSAYNSTRIFESAEFYFKIIEHSKSHVKLRLETARKGSFMELNYRLPDQGFNVESSWSFTGMQSIITENVDQLQWNWSVLYPSQELHKSKEREVATVYFKNTVEDPDNINPMTSERQEIQDQVLGTKATINCSIIHFTHSQHLDVIATAVQSFLAHQQLQQRSGMMGKEVICCHFNYQVGDDVESIAI